MPAYHGIPALKLENNMATEHPVIDRIRANADLVMRVAREELGETIGYDAAGVEWLDGYIQRQYEQGDENNRDGLVQTLGSYLGECIIHSFGGQWTSLDGTWAVCFDSQNAVYPFNKVRKQLEHGAADSVLSFYTTIASFFRLA
jgi:hypothetical protein